MKRYKIIVLVGFLIALAGAIMFFIGADYGSYQAKEHTIHTLEVHEDSQYYYVDIDGERYSYFK